MQDVRLSTRRATCDDDPRTMRRWRKRAKNTGSGRKVSISRGKITEKEREGVQATLEEDVRRWRRWTWLAKQHHERDGDGNTGDGRRECKWRWIKREWSVEEETAKESGRVGCGEREMGTENRSERETVRMSRVWKKRWLERERVCHLLTRWRVGGRRTAVEHERGEHFKTHRARPRVRVRESHRE